MVPQLLSVCFDTGVGEKSFDLHVQLALRAIQDPDGAALFFQVQSVLLYHLTARPDEVESRAAERTLLLDLLLAVRLMLNRKSFFVFVLHRALARQCHLFELAQNNARRLPQHVLACRAHSIGRTAATGKHLTLDTLQRILHRKAAYLTSVIFGVVDFCILDLPCIDQR